MSTKNNHVCGLGLVFTLLLVVVAAQTQEPYNELSNHWYTKCHTQTKTDAAFDKLYGDAVEFKRYLKYAFTFIPEQTKNFCNSERGNLEKRIKELSTDMRPCLAPNEKYMENFVYTSFTEFLHFLCHNNAESINIFFHPNAQECRNKLVTGTNSNFGNCFSKLLRPTATGQPNKKELCGDLTIVKQCFAETLTQQCPSYGAYKKLNEDFFKYVSKPCAGCAFYLNSILLVISLLASYLFSH
ncbi:unnamed protein product [Psylliodes chrysocephalus]|uniref:Uncharacterized protein n=1 Tax=Psylliodes chrysocephalus TaxID=3402493 RepID=A0A9P0D767_9CUCU|nr:unnamed protein product [Psylliodes chrysocephala]